MFIQDISWENIQRIWFVIDKRLIDCGHNIRGANNIYYISILLFVREILVYYLFFLGVLNLELSVGSVRQIISLMVLLFIIQIPASWIKYFAIGMDETWIGTVSYQGGELGLLVTLFACAFLISAFLYKKKLSYLMWIVLFFLFGIINEKRATVFVFPVLLVFLFIHYNALSKKNGLPSRLRSIFKLFSVRRVILITAAFSIILYLGGRLLPDFNPEKKVWGSFDIQHMYDYAVGYVYRDYYSYGEDFKENEYYVDYVNIKDAQKGRFRVIYEASKWFFEQRWYVILFGMGGGSFSTSYLTGNSLDIMFEKIGIRGATPFMIYILLETGIIGFMFMTRFFYRIYKSVWKQYGLSNNQEDKIFILGLLGVWFVFVFDSYVYSLATMKFEILTASFYFLLAICLKGQTVSRRGI